MTIGDAAISQGDVMRRLRDLERLVRELHAGRRLEAASIGRGGISIQDGGALRVIDTDGTYLAWTGLLADGQRGTVLRRTGGELAFAVHGSGSDDVGFVGIYDRAGQYIVTDDAASGRGMARPYIPVPMGEVMVPTATTTSATFVDLAAGLMPVQHPVLYAYLLVRASDGSTAGEVQMTLDGIQVGDTLPVSVGAYAIAAIGPAPLPATYQYGSLQQVRVQARRTAGAGDIGVRVLSVLGLESAFL